MRERQQRRNARTCYRKSSNRKKGIRLFVASPSSSVYEKEGLTITSYHNSQGRNDQGRWFGTQLLVGRHSSLERQWRQSRWSKHWPHLHKRGRCYALLVLLRRRWRRLLLLHWHNSSRHHHHHHHHHHRHKNNNNSNSNRINKSCTKTWPENGPHVTVRIGRAVFPLKWQNF